MILKHFSYLLLIIGFVHLAIAQPSRGLQEFLDAHISEHTQISIYAEQLQHHQVLDRHFEEMALIPASNVKLFTTALAWEILGPDFTFDTGFYLSGTLDDGVLKGDLVIEGNGDPTFGSDKWPERKLEALFNQLFSRLNDMGIRKIEGAVVLHTSPWKGEWHNRDWPWADIGNYYGVSSGSINVFENKYELTFSTSGAVGTLADIIDINPELDLNFENHVIVGPPHSGDQAYLFGDAHDTHRVVRGSVPKLRTSFTIKGSLPDPEAFFTKSLFQYLLNKDIAITNGWKVSRSGVPNENKLIMVYSSPPLDEIVDHINASSHNLFAEALYKYMSLKRPFLMDSKLKEWKNKGMALDRIRWKDGCGLSPFNRISAKDFSLLLKIMTQEEEFLNSFARPGKEGTLHYRFSNIHGLRAKTGSIEGVYALSGILENREKSDIVFSVLINNYYGSSRAMDREIEKLLRSWSKME